MIEKLLYLFTSIIKVPFDHCQWYILESTVKYDMFIVNVLQAGRLIREVEKLEDEVMEEINQAKRQGNSGFFNKQGDNGQSTGSTDRDPRV